MFIMFKSMCYKICEFNKKCYLTNILNVIIYSEFYIYVIFGIFTCLLSIFVFFV